jgi:signal transduction histidine kinase/DNA-binding response OmpR family regulator
MPGLMNQRADSGVFNPPNANKSGREGRFMLKNLNLKTKIFFLVTVVVVVSFLVVIWIVFNRSIEMAKRDAFSLAEEMAEKYKNEIKAELQGARVTSETLKTVFETLKDHNLTDRDMMNDILRNALAQKEYITAFCIAYDPGALDGKDGEYAGHEPEYDETGRFAPYWNKLGDSIAVEPLYDIDIADWYIVPKSTKQEYITDPYLYHVQGHNVMLASLIFPIIHQDKFIGIISSDIVLDKLQEMVSQVNIDKQGEYTQILSNSGAIVAHPDKQYLGNDMAETLPKDLLQYTEKAKDAIRNGEMYIASGKDFYMVYMPIRFSSVTAPWSVAVTIPMTKVLSVANGIRNYVIAVAAISICVIAFILYLIATSVTNPILALANAAKIFGEGNFDAKVPLNRSNDEIGVLSRAFKVMAEKIDDLIKKLQRYARELEEKNDNLNRLNEQLVIAKDHADDSNRAKSDFLSNMSHEMRTPLNAIIGMTAIGKSASDIERKDYAFGKIGDASSHLLGVINDILDMSKIEANKMELSKTDFDFEKMLRKVVNVINFRVEEKHQSFYLTIGKNIPVRLVGDDQRLVQVITNLLSNAVKFTPEGGSIRLDTCLLEENNDGVCTIQFEITDTGIGISEEQQARLFNSFQQADSSTSRKFGGTGLGLVISKRIVEMMDGQIRIKSELGKGASFIFTIQVVRGKAERPGSLLNPGVNWKNIRILVVDDDLEMREYFKEIAQGFGITCDTVPGGAEAVALFERNITHDIYFVDWKMPGMNGIELTKIIKARYAGNSVVTMISSAEWSTIADEAKAAGVDRFLPKPLFPSDIADCINECLGYSSGTLPTEKVQSGVTDVFSGGHLLLAEDVEINREIVLALLEPTELEIDCAENGLEVLRLFSENPERYDMIFMDVQMPEMDGLEATRSIRMLDTPKAKTIPIIAMTANVFREDIEKCLEAGMNDHLGKPLDLDEVFSKLHKYLPYAQAS